MIEYNGKAYDIECKNNYEVSKLNTYGTGGLAKSVFFPKTEEEAIAVFDHVNRHFDRFAVLGKGSNVLMSDRYYDGALICTKQLNKIVKSGDNLICQSGVTVSELLSYCVIHGLSGLEYLAGIPASVGGLALMNGGINSRHLGDDVISITVYDESRRLMLNKDCKFTHKHSTMCDIKCIILSVQLKVRQTDSEEVKNRINDYLDFRSIQPKGRSCGCVFKNPANMSAGKLIDEAGLKNLRKGNAFVSERHANFIINEGDRSADVYDLICEIKRRIHEKFGIFLEEEVVYIGEFNDFDC